MTHRVDYSPVAITQLERLYDYIASEGSPLTAYSFVNSIFDGCDGLDLFPKRGMARDDIRPGLRIMGFRRRVTIAFKVNADSVYILGVFYGGQDWEADLSQPGYDLDT